ncbi:hypothetical protein BH23CHL4_BH23CHL4_22120 [soil metagenome]
MGCGTSSGCRATAFILIFPVFDNDLNEFINRGVWQPRPSIEALAPSVDLISMNCRWLFNGATHIVFQFFKVPVISQDVIEPDAAIQVYRRTITISALQVHFGCGGILPSTGRRSSIPRMSTFGAWASMQRW